MAPLTDGIYIIRNAQFNKFAADLINADPYGPISAFPRERCYADCVWKLTNIGGNVVTLENCSAKGSYADVQQPVGPGAKLYGSPNPTEWTPVNYGGDKYALQTPDGNYVWELPRGVPYENIQLVAHTGKLNTRWYFERIGDNC